MRKFLAATLALVALASPLGAGAPGSALDGLWFKVKVKAKGWTYGPGVPEPKKASFSTTVFVNLTFDTPAAEGGLSYTMSVWAEDSPDVWSLMDSDHASFPSSTGPELYLFQGMDFSISGPGPESITCQPLVAVKASKFSQTGGVLKATFTSLGAGVDGGTFGLDVFFFGGATLKGKTVDVENLPFVP